MSIDKEIKDKFINIIKTINSDATLGKLFTSVQKEHLHALIKLWRSNDVHYRHYASKEHHAYINGNVHHDAFNVMWNDYIASCLKFRCSLLKSYHDAQEMPIHTKLPAQSPMQEMFRVETEKICGNIRGTCCAVCGDTENIRSVRTNDGILHFCEDCYSIQINM